MEDLESHDIEMFSRAETEPEVKIEVKDELCEAIDTTNSEETATTSDGLQPQFYEAVLPIVQDANLPLRCRLCAIPDYDMVDIFNPDETNKNILEKIEYCLPIAVKETDTLPTQACRLCLAHLELSYQFHKTVAEAERQLLALDRQTFGGIVKTEKSFQTYEPTDCDAIAETLEAISEIESSDNLTTTAFEKVETTYATEEVNVESQSYQPCSEAVFITESHEADGLVTVRRESGSNDAMHQNVDPFHPGSTSASIVDEQSICDLETPKEDCNRSIADEANLANLLLILEQSYLCKFCPRTFRTEKSRTRHNETVHAGEGRHSCQHCEKKFVTEKHRDDHQRTHVHQPVTVKRDAVVQAATRDYPCSLCDKSFKSPGVRQRHMQWHAANNWQCKDCGKTFKSARNLQGHSRACRPDAVVEKRSSTSNLKTKNVLAQEKNLHIVEEVFSCEYCGKEFSSRKTRDCHRRTHTRQRPFKCLVCEKTFITESKLNRHSTVHSDERNYQCSLCDKSFKALDAKKKHMASHADGELWQCDYCKNSFVIKVELRDHLRICKGRYPLK